MVFIHILLFVAGIQFIQLLRSCEIADCSPGCTRGYLYWNPLGFFGSSFVCLGSIDFR